MKGSVSTSSSSLFPLFPFSTSAANSYFPELQCYSSLMDSHGDFTARWLHISCILTHHSFSKLLNSSVKLMPFSLFGLISIRIWQCPMRRLGFEFPHIHTHTCFSRVFHQRGYTGVFSALQQPHSRLAFSALLEGSVTVMVDTSDLIPGS